MRVDPGMVATTVPARRVDEDSSSVAKRKRSMASLAMAVVSRAHTLCSIFSAPCIAVLCYLDASSLVCLMFSQPKPQTQSTASFEARLPSASRPRLSQSTTHPFSAPE